MPGKYRCYCSFVVAILPCKPVDHAKRLGPQTMSAAGGFWNSPINTWSRLKRFFLCSYSHNRGVVRMAAWGMRCREFGVHGLDLEWGSTRPVVKTATASDQRGALLEILGAWRWRTCAPLQQRRGTCARGNKLNETCTLRCVICCSCTKWPGYLQTTRQSLEEGYVNTSDLPGAAATYRRRT